MYPLDSDARWNEYDCTADAPGWLATSRAVRAELLRRFGAAQLTPGEPYTIWPRLDASVVVYARRYAVEVETVDELHAFARRPGKVWALVERDDLERLAEPLPLVEVARDERRKDGYVLLTTPPAAVALPER